LSFCLRNNFCNCQLIKKDSVINLFILHRILLLLLLLLLLSLGTTNNNEQRLVTYRVLYIIRPKVRCKVWSRVQSHPSKYFHDTYLLQHGIVKLILISFYSQTPSLSSIVINTPTIKNSYFLRYNTHNILSVTHICRSRI